MEKVLEIGCIGEHTFLKLEDWSDCSHMQTGKKVASACGFAWKEWSEIHALKTALGDTAMVKLHAN